MPDGSSPGTQADLRPERPLTRRELRAREATEVPPASVTPGALAALPARVEFPAQPARLEFAAPPAAVEPAAAAIPDAPAPAPTAPSGSSQPSFDELFDITPVSPWPETERRRSRRAAEPAADDQPAGIQPAAMRPAGVRQPQWQPAEPAQAARPTPAPTAFTPRQPAPSLTSQLPATPTALPATPTALPATPPAPPRAESTATRRDRDSAFPMSRADDAAPETARGGFDALFADLTVDDDELDTGRGRGGRSARAERAPKKPKKAAAKPAKATKATKAAKAAKAKSSRSSATSLHGSEQAAAVVANSTAAAAAAAAAATAAAAITAARTPTKAAAAAGVTQAAAAAAVAPGGVAASVTPPAVPAGLTPAVPSAPASSGSADFAAAIAAAAMESTPSSHTEIVDDLDLFASSFSGDPTEPVSRPASDESSRSSRRQQAPPAATSRRSTSGSVRRGAESAAAGRAPTSARPSIARALSTRPSSMRPSPTRPTARRPRGSRALASVIAMSFAALLAVATSVPSLSLLTPADVQAMALDRANVIGEDGQRVVISGGVLAQSVQSEGYESQTVQEYAEAAGIRAEGDFVNNPAGTIQWPFAVGVHIGDRFGYRDCAGCSSDHGGQDFNPGLGAEIQAIADGTVVTSTDEGGSLGVVVMIDHIINGELVTSVYAHMEYGSRRVEVGDTVEVADVLGTTGSTGMSTGPHLHFEIRLGGVDGTKVDPLDWLYANTN